MVLGSRVAHPRSNLARVLSVVRSRESLLNPIVLSDLDCSTRVWDRPSPDCLYTTGGVAELAGHVDAAHPGEYQRKDWPATEAG
jgi:hypothetical protein